MNRWLLFFKDRFSFLNVIALNTGITLSSIYLNGGAFHSLPFIFIFLGILFILALMHLIQEVKNLDKDKIAYPHRPLPKGVIKKAETSLVIKRALILLFFYSLLLGALFGISSGLSYLFLVAYCWLMEKNLGKPNALKKHPLFFNFLHLSIILPITLFAAVSTHPALIFTPTLWAFALMIFGAFLCHTLCHQLNPHIHPIFVTYLHFYGFRVVYYLAASTLILSAMGAIYLGLSSLLIPIEALVLAALSVIFFQSDLFRLPAMLSTLSLFSHTWALVIYEFLYKIK